MKLPIKPAQDVAVPEVQFERAMSVEHLASDTFTTISNHGILMAQTITTKLPSELPFYAELSRVQQDTGRAFGETHNADAKAYSLVYSKPYHRELLDSTTFRYQRVGAYFMNMKKQQHLLAFTHFIDYGDKKGPRPEAKGALYSGIVFSAIPGAVIYFSDLGGHGEEKTVVSSSDSLQSLYDNFVEAEFKELRETVLRKDTAIKRTDRPVVRQVSQFTNGFVSQIRQSKQGQ